MNKQRFTIRPNSKYLMKNVTMDEVKVIVKNKKILFQLEQLFTEAVALNLLKKLPQFTVKKVLAIH